MSPEVLTTTLLALERKVYDPEVRSSRSLCEPLFAEDFVEFGGNGQIYNKTSIIEALVGGTPLAGTFTVEDFAVKSLTKGLALATYRLDIHDTAGELKRQSLRSTIYREEGGTWRQLFHQATIVAI